MRFGSLIPLLGLSFSLLMSACEAPVTVSLPSSILAASSGELSNSSSNFLADYSLSSSIISLSLSKIAPGQTATVTVSLKNPALLPVISATPKVYIYTYGGTSQGYFGPLTNHHDGTYSATYTALTGGSANSIHVKVDDQELNPSGGLPTLIISGGLPQFIEIVSGNAQNGPAQLALNLPLVVRVRDASNTALAAAPVTWQVVSGGGSVSSGVTPTDSSGLAQINFTLGPLPGLNKLKASIYGTPLFVNFTGTGTAVPFQESWTLSQSNQSDFTFDPSKIDFNSSTQSCELRKSKQSDEDSSVLGFGGGTAAGLIWDSTRSALRMDPNRADSFQLGQGNWTPQSANLLSVYHLNEPANTSGAGSVVDSVGSANGSPSSVAFKAAGQLGSGAKFSAGSSFIDLGNQFNFTNQAFSFSYWINLDTYATDSPYGPVPLYTGSYTDKGYYNEINSDGSICFRTNQPGGTQITATASNVFTLNRWQHVVITRSGPSVRIYLNGVDVTSSPQSHQDPGPSNSSLYLGLYAAIPFHMNGAMDEVGIWNTALSPADVQAIYSRQSSAIATRYTSRVFDAFSPAANFTDLAWKTALPSGKELPSAGSETSAVYSALDANLMSGVVGLWHLNEPIFTGAPNEILDASGNGNHGTSISNVISAPGKLAASASFNPQGSGGAISFGNLSATNFGTGNFTLSTWFKSSDSGNQFFFSKRPVCNHASFYNLFNSNGTPIFEIDQDTSGNNYAYMVGHGNYNDGTWHHIVATREQGSLKIYMDSVLNVSANTGIANISSTTDFLMNGNPCSSSSKGQMDEAAVWSRALQPNEIKQLYLRGTSRLKFQVRACTLANCSDDAADTNWKGTDGTPGTYFSELNNNTAPRTGLGSVNASSPRVSFADFTAQSLPARFFQYRVTFESDDTKGLCDYGAGSEPCSPELQSVTLGPTHDYDSSSPSVVSKNGFPYLSLSQFSETLGQACASGVRYNLGVGTDSTTATWFYFNPASNAACSGAGAGGWCAADGSAAKSSTAQNLAAGTSAFRDIAGSGKVFVKAFLGSSGSSACALDKVTISGLK